MSYITQTRASVAVAGAVGDSGLDSSAFVTPVIQHVGNLTQKYGGVVASVTPLYTYPGNIPYGSLGGVVGQQTTYSWRTNKSGAKASRRVDDLSGEEIYKTILSGGDVDLDARVTGDDRIIDRKGTPLVGHTDYDSYDNGHEFWTEKFVNNQAVRLYGGAAWPVSITHISGGGFSEFTLDWWGYPPSCSPVSFAPPLGLTRSQRDYVGNRMYKSAIPTRPYSQTIRAIGETIKDGLPALTGMPLLKGEGAAGEYLNYQFGVAPTLSDVQKLGTAVMKSHEIVNSYQQNSGVFLRREREHRDEIDSQTVVTTPGTLKWSAAHGGPDGPEYDLRIFLKPSYTMEAVGVARFERTYRFSGAFTYALPDGDDALSRFDNYSSKANHLLGLQLSPDVIYDLTPFSWLMDWVADFGTVLDNAVATGTDHCVTKYAYNMVEDNFTTSTLVSGVRSLDGDSLPAFVAGDTTLTRKCRDRATPFGFGVDTAGLTSFQWSILAALGLSRGRHVKLDEPI